MKNIHGKETGIVLRDEIRQALTNNESFPFFQVRMAKAHDICVRYQVWHTVTREAQDADSIDTLRKQNKALEKRLARQKGGRNAG